MRVLAFYLPQFHPIPENDAWWGKGFTEWTNVTRARPLFDGHYQPRLPADLGFYDLRLPEVLQAQADLARHYGIHGFCYHYYWFKGGKRLLERPLEQMLAGGNPDFPFCLCWANHNWTRRWDGQDQQVLMHQLHDEESDIAFLHSVLPYFRDSRYIRVGNRPLLVVYWATLFPNLAATVARWHAEARRLGEPPPYLVAAESFDVTPAVASAAGFDATCEFPPHGAGNCTSRKDDWPAFHHPFSGLVLDYEKIAAQSMGRSESLRHFRTVTLNWDNTARKKSAAHMMQRFSLQAYHRWLSGAIAASRTSDPENEQFVFINAWNEWAEGTYLEPDQMYGHAYLEATRAAISGQPYQTRPTAPSAAESSPSAAVAKQEPDAAAKPVTQAVGCRKGRLSVVGIAMVGNEADFVEAFVRENCQLLDYLLIADHNSLDGTREILAELVREGLPISVERIDDAAYAQTGVTNRLLDKALASFDPNWILPIDADEILDVADRATLEAELESLGGRHGRMAWITHVPTAGDHRDQPHPIKRLIHRYAYPAPDPEENPFAWKLALNAELIGPYRDRYALEKGNHRIVFCGTQWPAQQPVGTLANVRLRHYPVRSYDQLAAKIGIGTHQKRLATGVDQAGIHWSPMWQALMAGHSDFTLLQQACRQYLDTGRKSAEQFAEVPIVADPLPVAQDLRLAGLRIPVPTLFMRWIDVRLRTSLAEPIVESAGKGAKTMNTRYDLCPWLFWREAGPELQQEQLRHQLQLSVDGRFRCGERCYVSPLADMVPTAIRIGNDCCIAAHAYLTEDVVAGNDCTFNPYATVRGRVTLGNGVRIGAHSSILGFNHKHEDVTRPIYQQGMSFQGITIGDDVWIGSNAVILDGLKIGSHCIVAAGAVVTRDVPDYAVVAGNPARVLRDRRTTGQRRNSLPDLSRRAGEQWPEILAACATVHQGQPLYVDVPGSTATSIRPLNDAIEIAAAFGAVPALQSRDELIARLQATQDAETGLPIDPLAARPTAAVIAELADSNTAYMVLSTGYALECLGARFARPLASIQNLSLDALQRLAAAQPWRQHPWGAGAWIDALGTSLWFNRRHFGIEGPIAPLFDWLRANCVPHTGLWGESNAKDGWLLPVNGFYRLTRGSFAQFGLPLPYPEAAIDTVLAHIRFNNGFRDRSINACNVLDVIHPLWLMTRQTPHRRDEILAFMEAQIPLIAARWIDGRGFAFAPGLPAGLQGTEMWLATLYLAADALGAAGELGGYVPRGVHRLVSEPLAATTTEPGAAASITPSTPGMPLPRPAPRPGLLKFF